MQKKIVIAKEYADQRQADVKLRGLNLLHAEVHIQNMPGSPLVCHAWSDKARRQMFERQQGGARRKMREKREPEVEFDAARYRLSDGTDGFPTVGIKAAVLSACHKDLGIPKTVVSKGLFIESDEGGLVRILSEPPEMGEHMVRLSGQTSDLRWRPMYEEWKMKLHITFDEEQLNFEVIWNMFERAGFGVGLGEWRPEKGGDWGRFEIA